LLCRAGKWQIGAPHSCGSGLPFARVIAMRELIRTNDAVVISFVESLLKDAGIACLLADQNMSVLDGSIGILPRRILVPDEDLDDARLLLADAGIGNEIRPD
jgi:hypothetical protein